jgi:hypothetical protein
MKTSFAGAVLIASLVGYADANSQVYSSTYVANGTFCVDEEAINLFNALNDLRTKGKLSTYYTATKGLKAACDSVAANGYWLTSNGSQMSATSSADVAGACANFVNYTVPCTSALNWSIGLAAAGQRLSDSWHATQSSSNIDSTGEDSSQRAARFGTLGTSGLVEYVSFADINIFDTQDALNELIMGSGNSTHLA